MNYRTWLLRESNALREAFQADRHATCRETAAVLDLLSLYRCELLKTSNAGPWENVPAADLILRYHGATCDPMPSDRPAPDWQEAERQQRQFELCRQLDAEIAPDQREAFV